MVIHRAAARHGRTAGGNSTLGGSTSYMESIRQFIRDDDGQDVVEYGLLIATIAIVVLLGVNFFGTQIRAWFETLAGRITTTGIS